MAEILANITANIGIFDIIDILVVAFIIYKILGFIRDSRAQQLVKGVLLLVAVFLLSGFLQLNTLNWILKNAMTVGILAVVILFQPELRRALERMGSTGLLAERFLGDKNQAKHVVDAFVDAVNVFSASRTGALIVIERQVSLGDVAENGTILNAEVSAELLGNIFYKGSPLHDGAAIIRGDKVFAAGCVLPLTARLDIGKELGTRHRAAIGITENSDAVAIVVSEENGIISVARDGKINRFLDSKGLEKMLLTLYLDEETENTGIFGFLKKSGKSEDAKVAKKLDKPEKNEGGDKKDKPEKNERGDAKDKPEKNEGGDKKDRPEKNEGDVIVEGLEVDDVK